LPPLSNAGIPETYSDLPTFTALETGMPRTGFPMYSKGSAEAGGANNRLAARQAPVQTFFIAAPGIAMVQMHDTPSADFPHPIDRKVRSPIAPVPSVRF
jgi:hypothetical protein